MWFITLIVLAVAAFFLVKMMKSSSTQQPESQPEAQPELTADKTAPAAAVASSAINSSDTAQDVSEMMKILNLAGADASRLGISADQLMALRQGAPAANCDLDDVASRLRKMLA